MHTQCILAEMWQPEYWNPERGLPVAPGTSVTTTGACPVGYACVQVVNRDTVADIVCAPIDRAQPDLLPPSRAAVAAQLAAGASTSESAARPLPALEALEADARAKKMAVVPLAWARNRADGRVDLRLLNWRTIVRPSGCEWRPLAYFDWIGINGHHYATSDDSDDTDPERVYTDSDSFDSSPGPLYTSSDDESDSEAYVMRLLPLAECRGKSHFRKPM